MKSITDHARAFESDTDCVLRLINGWKPSSFDLAEKGLEEGLHRWLKKNLPEVPVVGQYGIAKGTRCAALQIDYSILNRTAESEIFPYCQENNIGVIVRGALAMGILTGKFNSKTRFPEGDFRNNWQDKADERRVFLEDLDKVERLQALVPGRALSQLALRFVIDHPAVTTVIPGARSPEQVEEHVQAGLLPPLTKDVHRQIDAITPPGGGRKIWPA